MDCWRIVHSEASLGWGGQEHRVLAELTGFQKRGSKVFLLAPRESKIFERAKNSEIAAKNFSAHRGKFLFETLRLARWLRKNKIQILNTHSSRDGWLLGIAGKIARVPLIIRTRHIDVDYPNRWLSRHVFATFADHVLVTSDKIKLHLQKIFQLPDERISTVPTGIDLEKFSPDGSKAKFSGEAPRIGMISVLRSWKGHKTFLEAARLLRNENFSAQFLIVGDGPGRERIANQISELKLNDDVKLLGHSENVAEILRALDVLAIPSTKHEGIPQIGLQALATKTPVVGSDVGGIPEIIRRNETGRIFSANDARALADSIRETLRETETTKKFSGAGRKLVEEKFSLGKMFADLETIYRRYLPE